MTVIGHQPARHYLERRLPPATLLHGPGSIGKWTLAQHIADHHHVAPVDRWLVDHGMTIDTVRLITSFARRAPQGPFKLIIARLDGTDRRALNALLKTLEEPPPHVRFLLTSADKVLPTIASRCTIFELGELTRTQLESLYRQQGMNDTRARRAAAYARGQVNRGYQAEKTDAHRNQIINLAKALATGDRTLFTAVFNTWDGHSSDILSIFLTETLTHRWNMFTEADTFGLHTDRTRLWRMASAITRLPAARPRLSIRTALEPFLSR